MPLARTNRGNASITYTSTATAAITSGSFTPAAGALLLALWNETTTDGTPSLTMSVSGFSVGSWTTISATPTDDGFGNLMVCRIAYAVVSSSAAGTVTGTRRAGTFTMGANMEVIEVTGQAASPVPQSVNNVLTTVTSLPLNLGSAPAATSMLFSCCQDGDGTPGTVPSGFTGLASGTEGFSYANAEDLASGAQNNSWTGLGNFLSMGVLVEIAEAQGQPAVKRLGGHPFAPGRNIGSTVRRF